MEFYSTVEVTISSFSEDETSTNTRIHAYELHVRDLSFVIPAFLKSTESGDPECILRHHSC